MTEQAAEAVSTEDQDLLRVGGESVGTDQAERLVRRYLNSPAQFWSYPAYDGYPGAPGPSLGEQDLFAPMMLNAGLRTLRSYYGFHAALPEINDLLAHVPVDLGLHEADDAVLDSVADVFGILDTHELHGVSMTTLAKTLHRKRPGLIPLWDQNLWWCYRGSPEAPIPGDRDRTWRDFSRLVLDAIKADLLRSLETWRSLAALTPLGGPAITPLRALDIVGWRLGQVRGGTFDLPEQ